RTTTTAGVMAGEVLVVYCGGNVSSYEGARAGGLSLSPEVPMGNKGTASSRRPGRLSLPRPPNPKVVRPGLVMSHARHWRGPGVSIIHPISPLPGSGQAFPRASRSSHSDKAWTTPFYTDRIFSASSLNGTCELRRETG